MKYFQQFDYSDCGAACLAMICSYWGYYSNVTRLRVLCGTTEEGTNIYGLLKTAKECGLKATAVKGSRSSINTSIKKPFIVLIDVKNTQMDATHFVVIKKIGRKKIRIWNLDSRLKKQSLSYDDFF